MSDFVKARAWSDGEFVFVQCSKDSGIISDISSVCLNKAEAVALNMQLSHAIEYATDTPFERWWRSLSPCGDGSELRFLTRERVSPVIHRKDAQALFDEIRAVK